jgi:hypothetical protein
LQVHATVSAVLAAVQGRLVVARGSQRVHATQPMSKRFTLADVTV